MGRFIRPTLFSCPSYTISDLDPRLGSHVSSGTSEKQGHGQVCCARRRSPRTSSRKTDANSDCALVENIFLFVVPNIGGPGPPLRPPWKYALNGKYVHSHLVAIMSVNRISRVSSLLLNGKVRLLFTTAPHHYPKSVVMLSSLGRDFGMRLITIWSWYRCVHLYYLYVLNIC